MFFHRGHFDRGVPLRRRTPLKVGLYYGSSALFSANLQNYQGSGYELGWFDEESREFYYVGYLTEEKISMTVDGNIYISGGSYYADPPAAADAEVGGYHVHAG